MTDKGLADYAQGDYSERRYGKLGGRKILERESETYRKLLKHMGAEEGDRVLELGSNDALKSQYIGDRDGYKMEAADAEKEALEIAEEHDRAEAYHEVDAHDLPFDDNSFDYIIIPRMLHLDVIDEETVLEEASRVAEKGFAFDVFSKSSLRIYNSFMHKFDSNMPKSNLVTKKQILGKGSRPGWLSEYEEDGIKMITDFLIPFGAFKGFDSKIYVGSVEKVNNFFRWESAETLKKKGVFPDFNSVIYTAVKQE